MASKPDLNSTASVQNVVVYVSNDHFAQSYAVEQQNVPQQSNLHPSGYPHSNHPMASLAPTKHFNDKPHLYSSGSQVINTSTQEGYFENVMSQNEFPVNNLGYQSGTNLKNCAPSDVLSCERQHSGPGRPDNAKRDECDNRERYTEPYVTILGSEVSAQSVRCDSVRSETAESSCSSLSSVDEGMVVVQNHSPEMVVYDPSVSVRPGGVVLVAPPSITQHPHGSAVVGIGHTQHITVPFGWKRLLNNGCIIYISPSNTALSSLEQVKEYLLTSGTCKCGLECHFKYDTVFNFDPKVIAKPWVLSPDTNTGDLTKLCNHKRKIMTMASLDCKPPDLEGKMRKDYGLKKKKRKMGASLPGGISVSQILAQREKLAMEQQAFNKEIVANPQQVWPSNNPTSHSNSQGFVDNQQTSLMRCHESTGGRMMTISPVVIGDDTSPVPELNSHSPSVHIHSQQILGPNGQIINLQEMPQGHGGVVHQGQNHVMQGQNINVMHSHHQQQQNRLYLNTQPSEPSGPGRPSMHLAQSNIGVSQQLKGSDVQKKIQQQSQLFNNQQMQHYENVDPCKSIRSFGFNGSRPQSLPHQTHLVQNNLMQQQQMQQKFQWQHRMHNLNQQQLNQMHIQHHQQPNLQNNQNVNIYERVPPLHQHTPNAIWQDEIRRKKVKLGKAVKNRQYHMVDNCQVRGNLGPCPNIDVRQIPNEGARSIITNQLPQHNQNASSPSFLEDPSGYLAQQTALLNNTISRQTGANNPSYGCTSSNIAMQGTEHSIMTISNSPCNEVSLPSNINATLKPQMSRINQNSNLMKQQQQQPIQQSIMHKPQYSHHYIQQCQGCVSESSSFSQSSQRPKHSSRSDSAPSTPSSCGTSDDPVTSSMYSEKQHSQPSPDTRPIQGGTVSTSNVSPMDSIHSDPPTPNSHTPTPTPPQKMSDFVQNGNASSGFSIQNHEGQIVQIVTQSRENYIQQCQQEQQSQEQQQYIQQQLQQQNKSSSKFDPTYIYAHSSQNTSKAPDKSGFITSVVTTMASGRTSGCNTITSVLAGRTNTATVSINQSGSNTPPSSSSGNINSTQAMHITVSKSPLEMVQSVVSSIQIPHSQHHNITVSMSQTSPQMSPQIVKHSPSGLPPGHILVSSNGQLIMASAGTGHANMMAPPPPPKVVTSQNAMPPISVSPMVTNVTGAMSQVIPAVAQQVLGQQTVLVNTLPTPFVIQPGMTMTMDGMTVGQNMQIPQIVTGNVIQQQIQLDNNDARRATLLSPESKKKGKKRKLPSQTVAGMLHIAAQQNSGMVVNQQGFPSQIQMTHSPQGLTTTPMMQALTIVPSKNGGPPQIVMNGQAVTNANLGTQQIIANSQPTQQINLLQPVSLINGTTGVVQNIPAIQQFIVPNIGGSMVMNADGTATILQDTSNLGMQLHIQNVNGQNVLTPIQNSNMFNGGQSILATGPAGMVIRAPTSQGKIIQPQHSPGAPFLSPNGSQFVVNGAQFSGQLSPLVASVSPSQQVTFNTSPQQMRSNNQMQSNQQEFIQVNGQMGQTLMVPCTPQPQNITSSQSNQQNTTFVQQNTTIVQQQTTMVANNQQLQSFQPNNQQAQAQQNVTRSAALNLDQQNFMLNTVDKNHVQALLVQQQRNNSHEGSNYRQSVSTQTAVNQNSQSVTTNTFCQTSALSAGSPPDTTTLSPAASGGQSPPTADTTTHTGSTDDGLSPAPSNCSTSYGDINIPGRPGSRAMAMVHCVSSSEPDLLEATNSQTEQDWRKISQSTSSIKEEYMAMKHEFSDVSSGQMHYNNKKQQSTGQIAYEESNIGIHILDQKIKQNVLTAKHYGKLIHQKRSNDVMLVMDSRHMSMFGEEDDETRKDEPLEPEHDLKPNRNFKLGDLVWGPTKVSSSWPGKIVEIMKDLAVVKWFGSEKNLSKIKIDALQTLSEGFDSHHQARKKARTSRKLNTQLEQAIQEAMAELDKSESSNPDQEDYVKGKVTSSDTKKVSSRLRSGQR
ncbi:uncharacterized protein LOC109532970 isoform X3 [Dendroctonus ponderosae]|uniref:uncharacterized protein LOC109532970 isoform X3 n=1 Tax=Dendroctonus ponderosae TaxID=77166 RepID=UPI0020357D12|nr:uncharacterized protein LOC109532970 isoform X3 [Dendroctonus ponderosae]